MGRTAPPRGSRRLRRRPAPPRHPRTPPRPVRPQPAASLPANANSFPACPTPPSVVDDLVHELPCPLALRVPEELGGRALLDDAPAVDEHEPVADLAGEPHLVRYDEH